MMHEAIDKDTLPQREEVRRTFHVWVNEERKGRFSSETFLYFIPVSRESRILAPDPKDQRRTAKGNMPERPKFERAQK